MRRWIYWRGWRRTRRTWTNWWRSTKRSLLRWRFWLHRLCSPALVNHFLHSQNQICLSVWFSPPVISLRSESFRLNWRRWRSRDTLCRKRWGDQNMKCLSVRCLNSPPRHSPAGGARSHSPLLLFVSLNVFFGSPLSPPHRRAAPAECVQGAVPGVVHCGA